jgi:type VII secretion integral membrane protein EccD
MSTAPGGLRSVLRATVTSHDRRVDLLLPGAVPVADLLPELARSVGLLDAATAHGGFELVTRAGQVLAPGTGLVAQEVGDGAVLTVAPRGEVGRHRVHDDVAEAMADVVEHDLVTWGSSDGGRAAVVAVAALLALGAVALHVADGVLNGVAACGASATLVVAAAALSRARGERVLAVVLAWSGSGYAAVGGVHLPFAEQLPVPASALAGGAVALAGLAALASLGEGRVLALPPVVVGTVLVACGLAEQHPALDHVDVLMTGLVLVVLAGSVLPWVAFGVTAIGADQLRSIADPTSDAGVVDLDEVAADARLAHDVLLALTTAVGILTVLVAPLAAERGPAGTSVGLTCCAVVLLRTRQHRVASEVAVGLGLGGLALAALVVSVLRHHPGWSVATAALLGVGATALLVARVLPGTVPPWRRARLGDLAETTCLALLPPLLLLATGVLGLVRGGGA